MRVCIVTPRYPPNTKGGGEISCSIFARELSKYCDVEVISFDGSTTSRSEVDGVGVTRIQACPLSTSQSKIPTNLQAYNYLKKRVKDYDIFHTYNMDLMPAVGLLTKFQIAKSVATLNGAVFSSSQGEWYHKYITSFNIKTKFIGTGFIIRNKLMMPAIKNINQFTTLCPFYKERFGEDGISLKKIKVIPNMLDLNFKVLGKKKKNNQVRMLYMGHFRWRKGLDTLLLAYSFLKKQNIELIIAGYGNVILGYGKDTISLKELAKELGIKNNIKFLERIPYKQISELYATVDIFIQPYRYPEPIGRTLVEALQSGVCVITTGNDYYSPIIKDMEHGVLIYPCMPEKLAEKMQMLIDNPSLRKRLAKSGQQRVWEICAPEKIIPQYIKIYEKLIAAKS